MHSGNLRYVSCFAVALSLVTLIGCGGAGKRNRQTLAMTAGELTERFPWLLETSTEWGQDADLAGGDVPDYSHRGCFPVGNGRVFTTTGLRYPFGTIHNTFGPTYQKVGGSLGEQAALLLSGDVVLELPIQRTDWVMRAGMAHSRLGNADGVTLDIYDCVPPDGWTILRALVLTNGSEAPIKQAALAISQHGSQLDAVGGSLVSDGPTRWVRVGFVGAQTEARDEAIEYPLPESARSGNQGVGWGAGVVCPLGTIGPGESVVKLAYTVVAPDSQKADGEVAALEEAGFDKLAANHDWWSDWYSDILTVDTDDKRIEEFIPIQQHIVRVQQAESGGYSPMYMYTTCWVRDSNGPIRFMSQSGKFEEVKKALDYFYGCSARAGKVPMNWPLNVDLDATPPNVDWSRAEVEKAEVSSFIILQHYWYWKHSDDMTPIEEHWEYLRRNLLGQQVDEEGRLPFHDDETFRFPGYQIFGQTQEFPTDWVSMDLLSADSMWEYVAAATAMQTWAEELGRGDEAAEYGALARKVRGALDTHFWMADRGYYAPAMSDFSGEKYRYPFANINLRPSWLGPLGPTPAPWAEVAALQLLWKESGTVNTTPGCGYYVGMTPGMVVSSLARADHVSLGRAIEGLLNAASPSGGYSEMIKPDDTPSDEYWGKNRIRPWEGGINAEAVVVALERTKLWQTSNATRFGPELEPPAKAFDYGEPTFAGTAKTVVVTWSGETYDQYKLRPAPAAIDTRIAFPTAYLAAALYDSAGNRRADALVLDVSRYPGHCKTAEFWVNGEGRKVVDRFRELGGVVEEHPNPQQKPGDLFGA